MIPEPVIPTGLAPPAPLGFNTISERSRSDNNNNNNSRYAHNKLPTSKSPHHRTNFHKAYNPPVPQGYVEPPVSTRYYHPSNEFGEAPTTAAFAAALKTDPNADIPFDQEQDHNGGFTSDCSQPGKIRSKVNSNISTLGKDGGDNTPSTSSSSTSKKHNEGTAGAKLISPPRLDRSSTPQPFDEGISNNRSSPSPRSGTLLQRSLKHRHAKRHQQHQHNPQTHQQQQPPHQSQQQQQQHLQQQSHAQQVPQQQSRHIPPPPVTPPPPPPPPPPKKQKQQEDGGEEMRVRRQNQQQLQSQHVVIEHQQRRAQMPQQYRSSPLTAALASDHNEGEGALPISSFGYRMAPPRVSVPYTRPDGDEDEPSALTGEFSMEKNPNNKSIALQNNVAAAMVVQTNNSTSEKQQQQQQQQQQRSSLQQRDGLIRETKEDDDSLFDFDERKKGTTANKKSRKPSRVPSSDVKTEDEGDTSNDEAPTSLQQRAQAAWKRKQNRHNGASTPDQSSKPATTPFKLENKKETNVQSPPVVSFGKDDIVHKYDTYRNNNDNNTDGDTGTMDSTILGGRSINSLYTKSAESEVEDIIKDIFMIGSNKATHPGRRKLKYNPRVQDRLKKRIEEYTDEEEETYDDTYDEEDETYEEGEITNEDTTLEEDVTNEDNTTYEGDVTNEDTTLTNTTGTGTGLFTGLESTTIEGDNDRVVIPPIVSNEKKVVVTSNNNEDENINNKKKSSNNKKNNKTTKIQKASEIEDEKKEEDPLRSAWQFVEHHINAVGVALGLDVNDGGGKTSSKTADTTNNNNDSNNTKSAKTKSKSTTTAVAAATTTATQSSSNNSSTKSKNSDQEGSTISSSGGWNFLEYASRVLLGGVNGGAESEIDESTNISSSLKKSPSIEEDIRLVDLAVQAAMSMHRLNGCEFDKKHDIDIIHDIKFSVVDLRLPLGVIFQENEKGCWVTKILPEGSAYKAKGHVQVGDQLAAIDGCSAIDMTVDEIAGLIRNKNHQIELTFLRYVGPLRPKPGSVIHEEGYEIRATEAARNAAAAAGAAGNATSPRNKKKLTFTSAQDGSTLPKHQPPIVSPSPRNNSSSSLQHHSSSPKGILKNKIEPTEVHTQARVVGLFKKGSPQQQPKVQQQQHKKKFRLFGRRNNNNKQGLTP